MNVADVSLPIEGPRLGTARVLRRQLLRGAGFVLLLCLAIAALLTVTERGGFGENLVQSLSIGLCCWLIIDGGRHAASWLRQRARRARGLCADLPFGFPGWPWMIGLTLAGMTLGPVAGTALAAALGHPVHGLWTLGSSAGRVTWLLTLLASVVSIVTLTLLERLSHARADAEAARRAAAENQLKLLESQLEPHMLFNTLANLRVLIGSDPARAMAMLDRLIAFLRATLAASRHGSHSLADEFERVADYLALMQVRMGARLRTRLDLPEALRALPVPPLLLQPLVENAVKHGLEPKVGGGGVELTARREGAELVIELRDDGVGLDPIDTGTPRAGFGLEQVRERLRTLYGARARLEMQGDAAHGTLVRIVLPIVR